jgi:quercetin 2,3-dioxygenase
VLYACLFDGAERAELALDPKRLGYVHVAQGRVRVNGHALDAGDALMLDGESLIQVDQGHGAEVIVFDLSR